MSGLALPKVTGETNRARRRRREKEAEAFRDDVWLRDGGKSRASGKPVFRSLKGHPLERELSIHEQGQVCHFRGRRVMPEWKNDPQRAVLMTAFEHILSDHRGGNLLKLTDPETGEPATDAGLLEPRPIRFTLYDREGRVKWTRVG